MQTRTPKPGSPRPDDTPPDVPPIPTPSDDGTRVEIATPAEVEATMVYLLRKNAELYRRLAE